jgi:major membrane immunogen (membrane-anchored lipoprotein)
MRKSLLALALCLAILLTACPETPSNNGQWDGATWDSSNWQ